MGRWRQYHTDSSKIGIGTASLIAPRWALTAYHVAQFKDRNPNGGSAEIAWPGGRERNVLDVYRAPGRDIALIRLRTPLFSIEPVSLLRQSLLPSQGNIDFTLVQRSGKYRRTGHATNGGNSFRVNGNPPGQAGDSGGPWVIERFGSLQDVQFAVLHGSGTAPQIGPISGWIDSIVGEGTVNWVTRNELANGIPTDTHLWTGNGRYTTWTNQGNWNSGGNPGALGPLDTTNHETAQLRWISNPNKHAAPRLEKNWSLGRIVILNSSDHDLSIRDSRNWDGATGSGRKTILLNGVNGQAFRVRSDPDGTFSYTFQPGIRIKVDEDLTWDVYGDETLTIQGRVNGTGKIIKRGSGTLNFTGTGDKVTNNGSNSLEVLSGNVLLSKQAGSSAIRGDVVINGEDAVLRLNQDEQIIDSAVITLQQGLFDLNGKTERVGTVVLEDGGIIGGVLSANDGGFQFQSGTISSNLGGTGGLVKTTTGTVTLDGDNSYSGPTTVNEGTLQVNGAITSDVAVLFGLLGGTGTITGDLVVGEQGIISAGNSPGILHLDGDFSLAGTMLAELGGPIQGVDYDLFDVNGLAAMGGTLDIALLDGFIPNVGDTFDILFATEITLADSLRLNQPLELEHLFAAWTLQVEGGQVLRIGYVVGVPEPSSLVILLLGLLGLTPYRCRRKR